MIYEGLRALGVDIEKDEVSTCIIGEEPRYFETMLSYSTSRSPFLRLIRLLETHTACSRL